MKFCVDCRWLKVSDTHGYYCLSPQRPGYHDWVTGVFYARLCGRAADYRTTQEKGFCGPDAAWFEEKPRRWWQFWRAK